jgi:folylpolyglutamate synthase
MKAGQFTSPHLISVNERIKINSLPLSNELFRKYFWEVWDRLEDSVIKEGHAKDYKPGPFRFLLLLAFHVFLELKVRILSSYRSLCINIDSGRRSDYGSWYGRGI